MKRRARTKAEAQRALKAMQAEFQQTGRVADTKRTIEQTVVDYLEVRSDHDHSHSANARDERFCRIIVGYFPRKKLTELTVADVDRLLADVANGVSRPGGRRDRPIVGRDHLRRLRSFLKLAIRNDERLGYVSTNVAELANLPGDMTSKQERRAISLEQLSRLIDHSTGTTRTLVDLIGRHGLRPAEARAVTWNSFDFDRLTIRVKAQISAANTIGVAKTDRSYRVIELHPGLAEWIADQSPSPDSAALAAGTTSGLPIDRNNFARSIRRLSKQAQIETVRPYDLRHTAITHQCQRGYRAWQVADWAGTSERMIYLYYRHVLTEVIELPPIGWNENEPDGDSDDEQ